MGGQSLQGGRPVAGVWIVHGGRRARIHVAVQAVIVLPRWKRWGVIIISLGVLIIHNAIK